MSATETGRKVLAALNGGREKANRAAKARAVQLSAMVADLAHADMLAGRPDRGRAKRIALTLGISERHAKRILDTFSCVSDSAALNGGDKQPGGANAKRAA